MEGERLIDAEGWALIRWAALIIVLVGAGSMWGCPQYAVYSRSLRGEAALREASYDRQIKVAEATANLEAAKLNVARDSLQAMGAAAANRILGESLKNNEAYLRYLWIKGLDDPNGKASVVYVPTEANLPILEAGKRP